MKQDLYTEVSARIVAELEAGATPRMKPWAASAGMNTPCNGEPPLFWLQHRLVVDGASGRLSHAPAF